MNTQFAAQHGYTYGDFIEQLQEFYIPYYPRYSDITGGMCSAILLQAIIFWSKYAEDPDGICLSDKEIMSRLKMCLSEFKLAKKQLIDRNLIIVQLKGLPRRSYYKYGKAVFHNLVNQVITTGISEFEQELERKAKKYNPNLKAENQPASDYAGKEKPETCVVVRSHESLMLGSTDRNSSNARIVNARVNDSMGTSINDPLGLTYIENKDLNNSIINSQLSSAAPNVAVATDDFRSPALQPDFFNANPSPIANQQRQPNPNSLNPGNADRANPIPPVAPPPPFQAVAAQPAQPSQNGSSQHCQQESAATTANGVEARVISPNPDRMASRGKKRASTSNRKLTEAEYQQFIDCWNEHRPKGSEKCQPYPSIRVLPDRAKGQIDKAVAAIGLAGALDALKYGLQGVPADPFWSGTGKTYCQSPDIVKFCSNDKLISHYNALQSALAGESLPNTITQETIRQQRAEYAEAKKAEILAEQQRQAADKAAQLQQRINAAAADFFQQYGKDSLNYQKYRWQQQHPDLPFPQNHEPTHR